VSVADVPVFILCGGLGTRFKEMTEFRPKPMIPLGRDPILFHIMQTYARHGFRRFVGSLACARVTRIPLRSIVNF
jgi:glucose-1-phosphate cytidylyltransferase